MYRLALLHKDKVERIYNYKGISLLRVAETIYKRVIKDKIQIEAEGLTDYYLINK